MAAPHSIPGRSVGQFSSIRYGLVIVLVARCDKRCSAEGSWPPAPPCADMAAVSTTAAARPPQTDFIPARDIAFPPHSVTADHKPLHPPVLADLGGVDGVV